MNPARTFSTLCAVAGIIAATGAATAHPHASIDQQAALSLSRSEAVVIYRIVPSFEDGAHMFAHLDTNGDGKLSAEEQEAHAFELIDATRLSIDGERQTLDLMDVAVSDQEAIASGTGLIEIKARTAIDLDPASVAAVELDIVDDRFAKDWFIQPFYADDLTIGNAPDLRRTDGSNAIEIDIPRT